MYDDANFTNNNGFLTAGSLEILDKKESVNSLEVKVAPRSEGAVVVQPRVNMLDKEIGQSSGASRQDMKDGIPIYGSSLDPKNGSRDEALKYIQESLMNMLDVPLQIEGFMDIEEVLIEMALLDDLGTKKQDSAPDQ